MALTLMPGPDIVFVLTESITKGAKHGIGIALGLITGLLVHTVAAAIGLSIIIQESEILFTGIKSLGALYLFYLAYKSYREKPSSIQTANEKTNTPFSLKKLFFKGILMNLLNPKVSLFFIAFFPKFLFSENLEAPIQFLILGIIFILQAFLIFSTVSVFSSKFTFLKSKSNKSRNAKLFKVITYSLLAV
jgi:threonine/homoserine/homoserine lactone efflux protein